MIARRFSYLILAFWLVFAGAVAQAQTDLAGRWDVSFRWHDGAQQEGAFTLDLARNGTWRNNYNETGTWRASGDYFTMRYDDPPNSEYRGTVSGNSITGVITNGRGEAGSFTLQRSGASGASASDFIGRWGGSTDWAGTDYDSTGAWWQFNGNGTFVDNNGEGGEWSASGNRLTFQYVRANGSRGSTYVATRSGNSLRGTMTNGEISGTFALSRMDTAAAADVRQALVGEWSDATGGSRWRFSWQGDTLVWETNYNGEGWSVRTRQRGSVTPAGYVGFIPIEGNAFEVVGNQLWLHYDDGTRTERQTAMTRVR
ncbi:hypothetical protein [Terricaulis sp.]|uniref:hypothetical protein n=1 Tax=Terricaulis sp. TaxID=2768686 RepID=UPI002AC67935|nr:hypothetical protein [Terricaulis sp.]MDZ4690128.1 hypothetical protein [Terricaulis sp.]